MVADRFYFYMLTNRPKGVLYAGVTGDLLRRLSEHKGKFIRGFTATYGVTRLVYFEEYASINEARAREQSVKRWRRQWKFDLVEKVNPDWNDLTAKLSL